MKKLHIFAMLGVMLAILLVSSTAIAEHYPAGMVSYWKFDEGSGTTANDSVDANHGTIYGASWTTGKVAGALDFDGNDDYVRIPDDPAWDFGEGDFSVEAWVRMSQVETSQVIWVLENVSYDTPVMNLVVYPEDCPNGEEGLGFGIRTSTIYEHLSELSPLNAETWYHVVLVRNEDTWMLYRDGIMVASYYYDWTVPSDFDDHFIGRHSWDSGTSNVYFQGKIDEVAIYNRALIPQEIEQHYQNGLIGEGYLPTKADILKGSGVPGEGLDNAPGLQKPFNPNSKAADNAGKK
jgi:hypothetical protein